MSRAIPDRVMPSNLEAEKSVLGAVLLHSDSLALVSGLVTEEHFYRHAHRLIFRAMMALAERQGVIDLVTLKATLGDSVEEVGGPAYISSLIDGVPRSTNIEHYARIVRDNAVLRDLIIRSQTVLAQAYEAGADAQAVLAAAEESIYGLGDRETGGDLVDGPQMASEGFALIERLQSTGRIAGTPTGLERLDGTMLGLHRKHLTVVAARPGQGKSALMLHFARHLGMTLKIATAAFSLEMGREELIQRMMVSEGRVDGHAMSSGRISGDAYTRLGTALGRIGDGRLFVDDTAGRSLMQIRSQCRRLKAKVGSLDCVLIDYLQLMTPAHKKDQSREQEVGQMAWGCKMLAKEMNLTVVLLSQLSRGAEQRAGEIPKLSDLRESGQIEQHADDVIFLHPPSTENGTCNLIIAKQRNGPKTTVQVGYDPAQFRFWNLAPGE